MRYEESLESLQKHLRSAPIGSVLTAWQEIRGDLGEDEGSRYIAKIDRFYLLTVLLGRTDAFHPWIYDRIREVEADPDGHLDLWSREHYKSTVITYAGVIQEIIKDPEITVGIFSHTRPIATKFMRQIKLELESNEELKRLWPEIFWQNPQKQSPKWSENEGLQVMRKSNAKEQTVEAWGLVDGQPTGAHFKLLVYDDVVTRESVSTPEQIKKTTEAWELSDNLGSADRETGVTRKWHIGTRYHFADTYHAIMGKGSVKPRIYPATDNGQPDGKPVFLSQAAWDAKKRDQGEAIIASQMLQNPAAGQNAMFKKDWLVFSEIRPQTLKVYIMCDPANSKKKGSDRTAMAVIGVDAANKKWLLDGYCHKMDLSQRWTCLSGLRRHWRAQAGVQSIEVGYERYGMQSDIQYFEEKMRASGEFFDIKELNWVLQGSQSKLDRVQRLEPDFKQGRIILSKESKNPELWKGKVLFEPVKRRDHESKIYSLNEVMINEYLYFPFSVHDDFLDAMSRIYDMEPVAPVVVEELMESVAYVD